MQPPEAAGIRVVLARQLHTLFPNFRKDVPATMSAVSELNVTGVRQETDRLGEVDVPADKL
jgi:hypothetical protein